MGTLTDQLPRDNADWKRPDIEFALEHIVELAKKFEVSTSDVIELYKAMEMTRTNDLYRMNGDIHDEQMAGIGDLMERIADGIYHIGNSIRDND